MNIFDDYTSAILHNLDEGLAIVDTDFRNVYANKVLNNILETSDNDISDIHKFVSGDDMAIIRKKISEANGGRATADVKITTAKGNAKTLRLSVSPFFDTKRNDDGYIITVKDISGEIKDQIALKAALYNLDLVANSTADVILRYDFKTFEMSFVSKSIKYMAGYEWQELIGHHCTELFHPSVRQPIIDVVTSYVTGARSFDRGGHNKIRLPMLKKDGTVIMTEVLSSFLRDSNDRPIDTISIIHDISETLRYEKQLSEQNNVMHTLINNLIADVYLKDKDLRYKMANLRYAKSIGFDSVDQIIDKTDVELGIQGGAGIEQFEQHIINTANPSFNIEKRLIDQNGDEKWTSTSKLSYTNNDGHIAGVIGVIRDVTERVIREKTIESQKRTIELAHQETMSSINAAQRIQSVIMPFDRFSTLFDDSFVIYRPKDIVGGDFFYAVEKFGKTIATVGDCTGHGVSGALISTMSMSVLHNVIKDMDESDLTSEKILEELRSSMISTMKDNNEGFDISLIVVDKEKKQLQFSGAFNSLYYVRNGVLTEYPADKCPIGRYPKMLDFQRTTINYEDGDEAFMFSDGYCDQFGGPHNRRFGSANLRKLFTEVYPLPAADQKEKIERNIDDWMAQQSNEQIDDVTVMGIRF